MQAKEMPHMPRSLANAETLICTAARWLELRDHKSITMPHSARHRPRQLLSKTVTSSAVPRGHLEGSPGERNFHDLGLSTSHDRDTLGCHPFRFCPSNVTPKRSPFPSARGAAMVSLSNARLSGMRMTCSSGEMAADSDSIQPFTSSETSERRRTQGWKYSNRRPHRLKPFCMVCWRSN